MHEMSLAESVLQIVEAAARAHDATRVRAVRLELGALSHVEPDALRFSFEVVTRGTVAEDAALELLATPGRAWCMPCGTTVDLPRLGEPCPLCGSHQLQVTQGDEMRVKDIEIA
jgi:hydrogenase nickel incorporation protein HypA/HybF